MCDSPFGTKKCQNQDVELIFQDERTGKKYDICPECWGDLNKNNPDWGWENNTETNNNYNTNNRPILGAKCKGKKAKDIVTTNPFDMYVPFGRSKTAWVRKDTVEKSKSIKEYIENGKVNLRNEVRKTKSKRKRKICRKKRRIG